MVVKDEVEIDAPSKIVYDVASKTEDFPSFIPDVKTVKILDKKDNKQLTYWEANIDGIIFKWEEEDIFYPDKLCLEYKLVKGDVDKFEGYWKVTPISDNKSKLLLYLDFDVDIPMLASLVMPTIRFKVKKNIQSMLRAIKERAEKIFKG